MVTEQSSWDVHPLYFDSLFVYIHPDAIRFLSQFFLFPYGRLGTSFQQGNYEEIVEESDYHGGTRVRKTK